MLWSIAFGNQKSNVLKTPSLNEKTKYKYDTVKCKNPPTISKQLIITHVKYTKSISLWCNKLQVTAIQKIWILSRSANKIYVCNSTQANWLTSEIPLSALERHLCYVLLFQCRNKLIPVRNSIFSMKAEHWLITLRFMEYD